MNKVIVSSSRLHSVLYKCPQLMFGAIYDKNHESIVSVNFNDGELSLSFIDEKIGCYCDKDFTAEVKFGSFHKLLQVLKFVSDQPITLGFDSENAEIVLLHIVL